MIAARQGGLVGRDYKKGLISAFYLKQNEGHLLFTLGLGLESRSHRSFFGDGYRSSGRAPEEKK